MKNKELKAEMLKNGTYSDIRKLDKELYKNYQTCLKTQINAVYEEDYKDMADVIGSDSAHLSALLDVSEAHGLDKLETQCYLQMKKARHNQMTNMRRHIEYYTQSNEYDLIFATFTFSDESLNLKSETRRKKLLECLKNCNQIDDYICNIDYGKTTEREHYHGILFVKKGSVEWSFKRGKKFWYIENMPIDYKLGFCSFEKVGNEKYDNDRIASYVAKLNMHALKVKQSRLIVKRESPYNDNLKYKKLLFEKKK